MLIVKLSELLCVNVLNIKRKDHTKVDFSFKRPRVFTWDFKWYATLTNRVVALLGFCAPLNMGDEFFANKFLNPLY